MGVFYAKWASDNLHKYLIFLLNFEPPKKHTGKRKTIIVVWTFFRLRHMLFFASYLLQTSLF